MTGNALIAEGERLARPCVHPCPTGERTSVAAIWRGQGLVAPPGDGYTHWLSIDCRFLPIGTGPSAGCLSVYAEEDDRYGVVTHDPAAILSATRGGRELYARPAMLSLPPLEAVFLRGSPAVAEWLAALGWPADWGWNGNFPDAGIAGIYHEAQRAGLPARRRSRCSPCWVGGQCRGRTTIGQNWPEPCTADGSHAGRARALGRNVSDRRGLSGDPGRIS